MLYYLIPLVVIAAIILWAILVYNGLVAMKNQVENAWRQIDVQLKRRHDLVPNLVNTVKGAMEFERDTLTKVIDARSKAVGASGVAEKGMAENMLTQAIGRLFALMESYPDLKSSKNILQLQEELTSTENRIGFARQFYNDLTALFNTRQQTFPSMIIAGAFGFKAAEFFQAAESEKQVPVVDLKMK